LERNFNLRITKLLQNFKYVSLFEGSVLSLIRTCKWIFFYKRYQWVL